MSMVKVEYIKSFRGHSLIITRGSLISGLYHEKHADMPHFAIISSDSQTTSNDLKSLNDREVSIMPLTIYKIIKSPEVKSILQSFNRNCQNPQQLLQSQFSLITLRNHWKSISFLTQLLQSLPAGDLNLNHHDITTQSY